MGALGRNYGTILTLGAVDWAFQYLHLNRLVLSVYAINASARAAYVRAGFTLTDSLNPPATDAFPDPFTTNPILHMAVEAGTERSWQRWDAGESVERIREQWQRGEEQAHRAWLAMEIAARASGPNVLEVGCGTGEVYRALRQAWQSEGSALQYLGVDVSRRMLAWAQREHGREAWAAFEYGDLLTSGDLAGLNQDVAVCCEVLGHLPEARTALQHLMKLPARQLFVSLWLGDQEQITKETIDGVDFMHHVYAEREIYRTLRELDRDARIEPIRGPHTTLIHINRHTMPVTHTIILGSYNRPKLVREAIRSVLRQKGFPSWELIITDDGSNAETLDAIREEIHGLGHRCTLLIGSGPDGPRPDAQLRAVKSINRALPLACGDLIHYLPDDDYYPPERLAHFEKRFTAEVSMVYGRMSWVFADGTPQGRDLFPGGPVTDPVGQLDHTSVVHRRECLRVVPEWPEGGIDYNSDGVFFKRLVEAGFGPIQPMDEVVAYHRDHGYNLLATQGTTGSKREP